MKKFQSEAKRSEALKLTAAFGLARLTARASQMKGAICFWLLKRNTKRFEIEYALYVFERKFKPVGQRWHRCPAFNSFGI